MTQDETDTFVFQVGLMLEHVKKDQVEWAAINIKFKNSGTMGIYTTEVPDQLRGTL